MGYYESLREYEHKLEQESKKEKEKESLTNWILRMFK